MHDIIFCFERSGKKYYGAILSPATNIVILNLFQNFFCLSLFFSQSSPDLFLLSVNLCPFLYQTIITVCKVSISL